MDNQSELPEISESSCLSRDYMLALGGLVNYLEAIEDQESSRVRYLAKRTFLHREIPHYDAYFSGEKYADVVTPKNQNVIEKINRKVDQINGFRVSQELDHQALRSLLNEIITLIG